jgi:hypothetical protein
MGFPKYHQASIKGLATGANHVTAALKVLVIKQVQTQVIGKCTQKPGNDSGDSL